MPTIKKKQIKPNRIKYKNEKEILNQDHYSSPAWRNLRNTYISTSPLCECCLQFHRVTPATDVHHKRFWSSGDTEEEQWQLFLDWHNLQSLCESCHHKIHKKARQYGLTFCDSLTEKEYNDSDY